LFSVECGKVAVRSRPGYIGLIFGHVGGLCVMFGMRYTPRMIRNPNTTYI
jgi:hypothetical protein